MRTRRRPLAACVALVTLMAFSLVAHAQVFENVPSDALFAVKVRNLKATSEKLAKFATDLGLAQLAPPMTDPLGALEQELKITAGLDRSGDMAFAFLDPDQFGGDPEKSSIMLLPVSDYKAFLGNFPDAKTEGDISEFKLGDAPANHFMANWGKYAALSMNRDLVAAKPSKTMKLTAATKLEAEAKDVVLYANFPTIRAKVQPLIAENREKWLNDVEAGMKEQPETAKFAPSVRAVVNQLITAGDAFLRDTEAGTFGFSLTGEGIAITALADYNPESYIGKLSASVKNTSDLMLTGLPQGKYLVFGGGLNDPAVTGKVFDDFTQPVCEELKKIDGDGGAAITQYVASLRKQLTSMTGQSFGMLAPSGTLGQDGLFQFVNVMKGDAKAMRTAYVDMMQQQEKMMSAFGGPQEMVKTTFTPNAKTIDGVSFDLIQSQFNMAAAGGADAAGAQMMMTYMYGPNGVNVLVGDVNDKVIVAMGVPDPVISATIAAVKNNAMPLADDARVKSVAGQLAKQHTGVFFIAVDEWVTTGLGYAKQFGFAVPVQLPPDLPPVGVSMSTDGPLMRVDSYVPNTLVQSLVAAGMQAAMQMQGGGGPGKGGGL